MSSFSETWVRNTFSVEAVRVTEENMRKVANWCYGRIYGIQDVDAPVRLYIQFDAVGYNKHYAAKAFVGDWVLFVDGHFKHYEDKAFRKVYHPKVDMAEKVEKIREIVDRALWLDSQQLSEVARKDLVKMYTDMIAEIVNGEGK